tara:strand:+ start:7711 stop:7965 length:255 start_codon:yes stop_codon:yes gene_type:complete
MGSSATVLTEKGFGQKGSVYHTSGAYTTNNVFAIQALSDTQVDTVGVSSNYPSLTNITIPKGSVIYGNWSSVTVDSGGAILYWI